MKKCLTILLLCLPACGQTAYQGGRYSGAGKYISQGPEFTGTGENIYCSAGLGELTEGTPLWGTVDGVALLPTRCMNTAMSSTPSGTHLDNSAATIFTPATASLLQNVLSSANGGAGVQLSGGTGGLLHFQCGDTIVLNAGSTYTGPFNFPRWVAMARTGRLSERQEHRIPVFRAREYGRLRAFPASQMMRATDAGWRAIPIILVHFIPQF